MTDIQLPQLPRHLAAAATAAGVVEPPREITDFRVRTAEQLLDTYDVSFFAGLEYMKIHGDGSRTLVAEPAELDADPNSSYVLACSKLAANDMTRVAPYAQPQHRAEMTQNCLEGSTLFIHSFTTPPDLTALCANDAAAEMRSLVSGFDVAYRGTVGRAFLVTRFPLRDIMKAVAHTMPAGVSARAVVPVTVMRRESPRALYVDARRERGHVFIDRLFVRSELAFLFDEEHGMAF